MAQMPNSNKSALERARICRGHCCEGPSREPFHSPSRRLIVTGRETKKTKNQKKKPRQLIHLGECFVKGKDTSRLLCQEEKAEVPFCFCGIFYRLISTFSGKRPSAVSHKNQLPRGPLCHSAVSPLSALYSFANTLVIDQQWGSSEPLTRMTKNPP